MTFLTSLLRKREQPSGGVSQLICIVHKTVLHNSYPRTKTLGPDSFAALVRPVAAVLDTRTLQVCTTDAYLQLYHLLLGPLAECSGYGRRARRERSIAGLATLNGFLKMPVKVGAGTHTGAGPLRPYAIASRGQMATARSTTHFELASYRAKRDFTKTR
jgi:hypothetical protein